ncbi:putative transmembrane protein [Toxoplasma gondii p89]|uniref:Putative transmembrane protein n=1 Tax=Toxoplasma gondii p89 TaxID=943119 RepID=A0A086JS63_TOXGO|nr:putative transmembrane protein [Toxoplasma gondii p89]
MVKSRVKKTLARIENGLCSRLDEAPRSVSSACSCQTRPRMPARNFSLLSPAFRGHHRVHGMCSEFEDKGLGLSTRFFCFRLFSLAKNLRDDSRRGSDSGAGEPTHLRRGGRSSQQECPRQERPSIFFVLTSLSLFFVASSSLLCLFFVCASPSTSRRRFRRQLLRLHLRFRRSVLGRGGRKRTAGEEAVRGFFSCGETVTLRFLSCMRRSFHPFPAS